MHRADPYTLIMLGGGVVLTQLNHGHHSPSFYRFLHVPHSLGKQYLQLGMGQSSCPLPPNQARIKEALCTW